MLKRLLNGAHAVCPPLIEPIYRRRRRGALRRLIAEGRYTPATARAVHYDDYERSTPQTAIPHIFHQTWKTADVPAVFTERVDRLRALHPSWRHEWWTDDAIRDFVNEHFPHYRVAFDRLPRNIMRVDLFRYMLLSVRGGVYCDLDVWFFRPIDPLVADCTLLLPGESDVTTDANFLAQHLLASRPGHPFWQDLLADALDVPLERIDVYDDPIEVTGPNFVTRVYRRNAATYRAKIPMRVDLCPPSWLRTDDVGIPDRCVAVHECTGTWR